jgi:predicted transcriptional regulator
MQEYKFLDIAVEGQGMHPIEDLFDCLLGLSKPEISVFMRLLAHPGGCCLELARAEGKDRSVVQRVLKKLFDNGWIERAELERGRLTYKPLPPPRMRELLLRRIEETRERMIDVVNQAFK